MAVGSISVVGQGRGTVTTHTPSDPEDAEQHRKDCAARVPSACHAAALDAYYAPHSPETDARARRHFELGCELGYAPSCNGLGVLAAEGRGVPQDDRRAASLFRKACEDGAPTGCQHLADALERDAGVPRDPSLAKRAHDRASCLASRVDAGPCLPLP